MLQQLFDLGFTESEGKVYIALLELGASPVSVVAKRSGLNRVGCYHTLDKLVDRGLVSSFSKNKIKYFSIESPEILVKKQEEKLNKAEKLLPELLLITNALAYKPKIHYYEGVDGVKNVFDDTLNLKGEEILGYTNFGRLLSIFDANYMDQYLKRRVANNLSMRMLSPKTDQAIEYSRKCYGGDYDRYLIEIFFVNPREFMFDYEIRIYGNRVSIISLNQDEVMAWLIESKKYADTQRAIFNLAWLGATSFVVK